MNNTKTFGFILLLMLSVLLVPQLAQAALVSGNIGFDDGPRATQEILQGESTTFTVVSYGYGDQYDLEVLFKEGSSTVYTIESDSFTLGTDRERAATWDSSSHSFTIFSSRTRTPGTYTITLDIQGSDGIATTDSITLEVTADTDYDGIPDEDDNCPEDYNPDQADKDGDDVGNECDTPYFTEFPSNIQLSEEEAAATIVIEAHPNSGSETLEFQVEYATSSDGTNPDDATVLYTSEVVSTTTNGQLVLDLTPLYAFVDHNNYLTGGIQDDFEVTVTVFEDTMAENDRPGFFEEQASDSFTVTVDDLNQNPIADLCEITIDEDSTDSFDLTTVVSDADGDDLLINFLSGESWMTLVTPGTLEMDLTGQFDKEGSYTAQFIVRDYYPGTSTRAGAESTLTCTVTVNDLGDGVNEAPVISGPTVIEVMETQTAQGTVSWTDAEGDSLTVAVTGDTGTVDYTQTATDLEIDWQTIVGDVGTYTLTVTVSDADNTVSHTVTIIVNEYIEPNYEPDFDQVELHSESYEGQVFEHSFRVEDPEADDLTFSAMISSDALMNLEDYNADGSAVDFTYDETAGQVTFAFMPSYEFVIHPSTQEDFEMVIRIDDGTNVVETDVFKVIVNDVNRDPQFTSTPSEVAVEGEEYTYDANAQDADDEDQESLHFEIIEAPEEAHIDEETGVLTWNAVSGTYTFTIMVQDQMGGYDTQTWTVNASVAADEEAPTFDDLDDIEEQAGDNEASEDTFTVDDNVDEDVNVEITEGPDGVELERNDDGSYTVSYEASCDELGLIYSVTIRATDASGNPSDRTITITVVDNEGICEDDNDRDDDGVIDDEDNCPDTYNPDQSDIDGDDIGDVCDDHDDRVLDKDFDGIPDEDDNCPDTYNPDQADTDGDGIGDVCDSSDDRPNDRPIVYTEDLTVYEGATASMQVSWTDRQEYDDHTVTTSGIPSDATIESCANNVLCISWTTVEGDAGSYDWTFTVSDGKESTTAVATVTVLDQDDIRAQHGTLGRAIYTNVQFASQEVRAGDDVALNVALENDGFIDLESMQVNVVIPELGRKFVSSSFDLETDEQIAVQIPVEFPAYAQGRTYLVQITVGNDDYQHQTYREIRVI